ncbi:zonular occludens toxin family protein [Candidatus Methylobacter oryzae]|uniref:Zona occludens toxin N-terminal domain-containing protein n=1 Tax=Candidatus Methylobacter oryzae TaxID=2497749 RepID=A0ABY3CCG1_9GAMM|nr:zonular occludens toxin domain-containing protein [Candidatus Methylobacter oryzae]TRW98994.1 hypothetical protein EKO24_006860 [Candidatus Methylobacter oryzae]
MATSIHHGPPGSFKSFTLVQRFGIDALKQGRAIVTNIRGFNSVDRVIEQFPDEEFPDTAIIIWVDTRTKEGRAKMARWFHWVPFGAMIIIDEIQQIYPDRRDFKLESLDTYIPAPGEVIEDIGLAEGRPEDVFTAYDKQRHYNWDILASTTNIAKVKREIREVSEWAYRHRDISNLLPWYKNTWIEHQHDPENNGKSASHRVGSPAKYKADPRIFKCYDSTATGNHIESTAGRSIFADRKILAMLALVAGCLCWFYYTFTYKYHPKDIKSGVPADSLPVQTNIAKTPSSAPGSPATGGSVPVNALPAPVTPADTLDRSHLIAWSQGITVDDLPLFPKTCNVTRRFVKCSVDYDDDLIRVSTNHICSHKQGKHTCDFIFTFKAQIKSEDDKKKSVIANNMPF